MDVRQEILSLLSESISCRTGEKVDLKDIMDYDDYRKPISQFVREDFVLDHARGNIALSAGDIVLPSDIDKIVEENISLRIKK